MRERHNPWLRGIDYFLGCPVIYFLGKIRKKNKIVPRNINRVLMMKTAAIGDTILVSAIIDEIKRQYPQCQIDIICSKNNVVMARLLPNIAHVYIFDMSNPISSLEKAYCLNKYDLLFDFAPWWAIASTPIATPLIIQIPPSDNFEANL